MFSWNPDGLISCLCSFFWQLPHYGVVPSGSEMKGAGCNLVQLKPFFRRYSKILAVEMQLCLLSKACEFIFLQQREYFDSVLLDTFACCWLFEASKSKILSFHFDLFFMNHGKKPHDLGFCLCISI